MLVEHLVEVEVGVGNGLAYQPGLGAKEVGEHPRYIIFNQLMILKTQKIESKRDISFVMRERI